MGKNGPHTSLILRISREEFQLPALLGDGAVPVYGHRPKHIAIAVDSKLQNPIVARIDND